MQEKPTNELDELLGNMKPSGLSKYYKENSGNLLNDEKAFYHYFKEITKEKNIFLKDVYSFAGVSESYGSKIITMEKHTKNRDLIIRLCIAAHFSIEESNKALKIYGMSPLYAKDKRDACMIVAINNRIFDLAEIDEILETHGFDVLSTQI